MDRKIKTKQRGVVILFAVLLVSVVLTISLGVFNITYRQLLLSSIAKESEVAFAVADSARNCAQYWDSPERLNNQRPFGYYSGTPRTFSLPDPNASVTCAGQTVGTVGTSQFETTDGFMAKDPDDLTNHTYYRRIFELVTTVGDRPACALVDVRKDKNNSKTIMIIDGYNMSSGQANCVPTNLNRAVQRTIQTVTAG